RLFGDLADQLPVLADDLVDPAAPVDVDHAPHRAGPRRGDRVHGPAVSDGHADLDVATDLPRRAEGLRVRRALVEMLARSRLAGVRPVPARRADVQRDQLLGDVHLSCLLIARRRVAGAVPRLWGAGPGGVRRTARERPPAGRRRAGGGLTLGWQVSRSPLAHHLSGG